MLRVEIFWGTEYSSTSSSVEKSFPFKLAKKFLCYLTLSSTNLLYPASGDVTTFLMTEARQQNTEIRMAISKVVDKIDNLASKVWSISCLLFLCFFFFFFFSEPLPSFHVPVHLCRWMVCRKRAQLELPISSLEFHPSLWRAP